MVEFIRVTAKTPLGDTKEYMFMGDLDEKETQERCLDFLISCCDDCADKFSAPDDWDPAEWRRQTAAMWESVETNRTSFGGYEDSALWRI